MNAQKKIAPRGTLRRIIENVWSRNKKEEYNRIIEVDLNENG